MAAKIKEYMEMGLGVCLVLLLILFFSWLFGYFYNGFTQGKFDIDSCWKGAGIVGSGFFAVILRYFIDSKYNSVRGSYPTSFGTGIPPSMTANSPFPRGNKIDV